MKLYYIPRHVFKVFKLDLACICAKKKCADLGAKLRTTLWNDSRLDV